MNTYWITIRGHKLRIAARSESQAKAAAYQFEALSDSKLRELALEDSRTP